MPGLVDDWLSVVVVLAALAFCALVLLLFHDSMHGDDQD